MIDVSIDAGIATLTWDMPGRSQNVVNRASLDAFSSALDRVLNDDAVTGIILTSGKSAFLAGADLDELKQMAFGTHTAESLAPSVGALGDVLRRMETGGKPVVAAINGTALGGGYEICLACHRRICADSRMQIGLPESQLGLLPGAGGTQRLPRLIGIQASMPLLLEGKQLDPARALKAGMVDEVVPAEQLLDAARAWLATAPSAVQPWDVKGARIPGGGPDDPRVSNVFMVANAMFAAKTHGNYPAGGAILSCLFEGLRMPIDPGLAVEKRYFISLVLDPRAGAMIRTLFFGMQEASKLARRPQGVDKKAFKRIGVLGAGLMGSGIAYSAAKAGIEVVVLDVSDEAAQGAVAYAKRLVGKRVSRGRMSADKAEALLSRITPTTDHAQLAGADAVIEAVFEDRAVKADVTAKADAQLTGDAVFGSNTSTLPITGLAAASSRPEKFVGLHFFSPVEKMALVEVILGEQTSDETLAHALDLVQALGKTPIVVRDSRGFYTSRVFGTYLTEGLVMAMEGVAPALVENAGRASGMPMPPLGLADEVGLQLMHAVGEQTRRDLGDAAPDNPSTPVLKALVEAGRTGKRAGKGFSQ